MYALLIERCLPGTPLGQVLPEPEQDLVVAGLLRRLWAQPHAGYAFRPLAQMCQAWAEEFDMEYAAAGAADRTDPGLAQAGMALFRELPTTADRQVLLCTDLHGDNILAARREPWLVIDPKPYVGDPAWPGWTPPGWGSGYSPAACKNRPARRSCARWPGGLRPRSSPRAGLVAR